MKSEQELLSEYILEVSEGVLKEISRGEMWIYGRLYRNSLLSLLKNKYVSVYNVLGNQNFHFFAQSFVKKYKSRNENIDLYGSEFGVFLSQRRELEDFFYLQDFSKLDRLLYEKKERVITVQKGVFSFWEQVCHKQSIKEIEVLENSFQTVSLENCNGVFQMSVCDKE